MLLIRTPELSFFGDGRDRKPWMMKLQSLLEPLEIIVSPLDCLAEAGGLHNVGIVRVLENTTFLFDKLCDLYLHFLVEQLVGRHLNAVDDLRECLLLRLIVKF